MNLVEHVDEAVEKTLRGESKLEQWCLDIDGMSSPNVRRLLNNIGNQEGMRYLEIGVWKGSTFCSALFGNLDKIESATAIDNWSQFEYPREIFLGNLTRLGTCDTIKVLEEDCFAVDLEKVGRVTTYFYDGDHQYSDQYKALEYYLPVLADEFIFIVDDAGWPVVKEGTDEAIKDLQLEIVKDWYFPSTPGLNNDPNAWWNGFYVAVLRKP